MIANNGVIGVPVRRGLVIDGGSAVDAPLSRPRAFVLDEALTSVDNPGSVDAQIRREESNTPALALVPRGTDVVESSFVATESRVNGVGTGDVPAPIPYVRKKALVIDSSVGGSPAGWTFVNEGTRSEGWRSPTGQLIYGSRDSRPWEASATVTEKPAALRPNISGALPGTIDATKLREPGGRLRAALTPLPVATRESEFVARPINDKANQQAAARSSSPVVMVVVAVVVIGALVALAFRKKKAAP